MSFFEMTKESFVTYLIKNKSVLQLLIAISSLLMVFYFCVSLFFANLSLDSQLTKITEDRTYLLKAIEAYNFENASKELKFDVYTLEAYLENESKLFNNFSLQSNDANSIYIIFDFQNDIKSLNRLTDKIVLIKNIIIEQVDLTPNVDTGYKIKYVLIKK